MSEEQAFLNVQCSNCLAVQREGAYCCVCLRDLPPPERFFTDLPKELVVEGKRKDRRELLHTAYTSTVDEWMGTAEDIDTLGFCFAVQTGFMAMLRVDGRFPDWPLDLTSKENQRKLQGFLWDTVREISEASACLKNRPHRVKEEEFDGANFLEEMADAFAFFMESLILAGYSSEDLYDQYLKKMKVNREGLITGDR